MIIVYGMESKKEREKGREREGGLKSGILQAKR